MALLSQVLAMLGGLLAIALLALGSGALWYRKFRLTSDGRCLYGASAQMCGLLLLAPLLLAALTYGQASRWLGLRPDAQLDIAKVLDYVRTDRNAISPTEAERLKQDYQVARWELAYCVGCDLFVFGLPCLFIGYVMLELQGIEPRRRTARHAVVDDFDL